MLREGISGLCSQHHACKVMLFKTSAFFTPVARDQYMCKSEASQAYAWVRSENCEAGSTVQLQMHSKQALYR